MREDVPEATPAITARAAVVNCILSVVVWFSFCVIWCNESMGEVNSVRNLVLSSVLLSGSRCCRR